MKLDGNTAPCPSSPIPVLSGTPGGSPQENLNNVLDHAMANAEISLRHVTQMIVHVGIPMEDDRDDPVMPGVLGKSFALRTQLQKLNQRLEALAGLL